MNIAFETMMAEHRLIVSVLGSLQTLAQRLRQQQPVPRRDVARFALFFREFADKCHHAKEEDRLFTRMTNHGFSRQFGPVAVMLAEHSAGRELVAALASPGADSGTLTTEEAAQVIAHAERYVTLLMEHIRKEDHVLYPMAQQALPASELAELDDECGRFDRQMQDAGELRRLKDLAAQLISDYPAAPARPGTQDCPPC